MRIELFFFTCSPAHSFDTYRWLHTQLLTKSMQKFHLYWVHFHIYTVAIIGAIPKEWGSLPPWDNNEDICLPIPDLGGFTEKGAIQKGSKLQLLVDQTEAWRHDPVLDFGSLLLQCSCPRLSQTLKEWCTCEAFHGICVPKFGARINEFELASFSFTVKIRCSRICVCQ